VAPKEQPGRRDVRSPPLGHADRIPLVGQPIDELSPIPAPARLIAAIRAVLQSVASPEAVGWGDEHTARTRSIPLNHRPSRENDTSCSHRREEDGGVRTPRNHDPPAGMASGQ
jgi:hypothetical protein